MKRAVFAVFAIVTIGVLVAFSGCGGMSSTSHSESGSSPPTKTSASLFSRAATPLGRMLVGANGRTLYLFEADTNKASTCSGACAQAWPPLLTSGAPQVGSGVTQSLVGTTQRSDGTVQVTYNGHPLYYFSGDTKQGDAKGEGSTAFGAGWYVVSPSGNKIEQPGS